MLEKKIHILLRWYHSSNPLYNIIVPLYTQSCHFPLQIFTPKINKYSSFQKTVFTVIKCKPCNSWCIEDTRVHTKDKILFLLRCKHITLNFSQSILPVKAKLHLYVKEHYWPVSVYMLPKILPVLTTHRVNIEAKWYTSI